MDKQYSLFVFIPYKKRKSGVKYYIDGHKALVDILPISQNVNCRAFISNKEASRQEFNMDRENINYAPIKYI